MTANPIMGVYVRRFRDAAAKFLALGSRETETWSEHQERMGLGESCGIWLIEADGKGLIPPSEATLRGLIHEYTLPDGPPPQPGFCALKRCPYNLFLAVCAGGTVVGKIVEHEGLLRLEPDGEVRGRGCKPARRPVDQRMPESDGFVGVVNGRVVKIPTVPGQRYRETGGLMESIAPGGVERSEAERCSEACDYLADVIENATAARKKPGKTVDPNRQKVAARVRELKLTSKWQAVANTINREFPRPGKPWTAGGLRRLTDRV